MSYHKLSIYIGNCGNGLYECAWVFLTSNGMDLFIFKGIRKIYNAKTHYKRTIKLHGFLRCAELIYTKYVGYLEK